MTQIYEKEFKCTLCGNLSNHEVVISTNILGWPDLDSRPSEMARSTMYAWIQRCPSCGYCARYISEEAEKAVEIVQSNSYRKQLENPDYPKLANSFLCRAMISQKDEDFSSAGWASLKAAWACDDENNYDKAKECRLRAVEMFKRMMDNGEKFSGLFHNDYVILTDLLRRAERFDEALTICEEGLRQDKDEESKIFLEYEKALIEKQDTKAANSSAVLFAKVFHRMEEKGIKKKVFTKEELNALIKEAENDA